MKKELLRIENLSVSVNDKQILKDINLTIHYGEVHVLMGPNGSGKSTLANVLMNHPAYQITSGKIFLNKEDITQLSTNKRALLGLFMSFQTPQQVPGITVENFLRTAKIKKEGKNIPMIKFQKELKKQMDFLQMDYSYASRYLNEGFSGGEKKKNEILQMLLLDPKLAILDETDSGLDVDATRIVSQGIRRFICPENAALIITHHQELIKNIEVDYVHVLFDGQIIQTGGISLVQQIEQDGFQKLLKVV